MGNNHGGEAPEGYGEALKESASGSDSQDGAQTQDEALKHAAVPDTAPELTVEEYKDIVRSYVNKLERSNNMEESLIGRSRGIVTSVNAPPSNLPLRDQAWMLPVHRWFMEALDTSDRDDTDDHEAAPSGAGHPAP